MWVCVCLSAILDVPIGSCKKKKKIYTHILDTPSVWNRVPLTRRNAPFSLILKRLPSMCPGGQRGKYFRALFTCNECFKMMPRSFSGSTTANQGSAGNNPRRNRNAISIGHTFAAVVEIETSRILLEHAPIWLLIGRRSADSQSGDSSSPLSFWRRWSDSSFSGWSDACKEGPWRMYRFIDIFFFQFPRVWSAPISNDGSNRKSHTESILTVQVSFDYVE